MHRGTRSLDDTRGGVPVYFLGLTVLAVAMLVGTRLWDAPSQPLLSLLASMASLDPGAAGAILATAAEVTAGVLAIAMTVVAIVVELAANRYSHRITFLFIREPVNVVVLSLFLLTTLQCVWMAAILADPSQSDTPRAGVALSLGLVSLSLLTLLPYFAFVFSFISPLNVIDRIRRLASRAIEGASDARLDAARSRVLVSIDELQDVARGAIEKGDRGIAMACVDSLYELLRDYEKARPRMPGGWSDFEAGLRDDPDFVSLPPQAMTAAQSLWVETKVLRQYLSLMNAAVPRARDLANVIGIRTCAIGREAGAAGRAGTGLLDLTIRCFNSYLRISLNARDLRTSYYLTNQYRLLAEALLENGRERHAAAIVGYFQSYGVLSHRQGQSFLLEVVAHDIVQTIRRAVELGSACRDEMIGSLLEVDQEIKEESQELSLLGVRRSQLQLAAFLLERGEEAPARRICADMRGEDPGRIRRILRDLESETDPWYHELTDRAVNLAHLEPELRRHLPTLSDWLVPSRPTGVAG